LVGEIEMSNFEGICRFCGEHIPVLAADQKDADLKAEEYCNCGGFAKEKKHKAMMQNIENLFGDSCRKRGFEPVNTETLEIIKAAAEGVFTGAVLSVSIGLGGTAATVTYGKKQSIKITRKFSSSTALET
jgi:hypothetical protein